MKNRHELKTDGNKNSRLTYGCYFYEPDTDPEIYWDAVRKIVEEYAETRGLIKSKDWAFGYSVGTLHVFFPNRQGLEIGWSEKIPTQEFLMNWLAENWDKNYAAVIPGYEETGDKSINIVGILK